MDSLIFHVFNKSIAGYKIFCSSTDFLRMLMLLKFFQSRRTLSFSTFLKNCPESPLESLDALANESPKGIRIIAYCLMPTHLHLTLEGASEEIISQFINHVLNSYTRYFNTTRNRKGPLWQSRSKKVLCESDEQLLHLTRYIHLNPVTAYLADDPSEWEWSSYHEYMDQKTALLLCDFKERINLSAESYGKFVIAQIDFQRKLAHLKPFLTAQV